MDGDIGSHPPAAGLAGDEAAFEREVRKAVAHPNHLGTEDAEGLGVQLPVPVGHGSKDGQAAGAAIVEDFGELGGGVAIAEVGFVQDQGPLEGVLDMEDGRHRRCA